MINIILRKVKYPKFLLLLLIYIITIAFFYKERALLPLHNLITSLGSFGVFLGGFFYAYGFTAAPATAILLVLAKQQNNISAGIIGGLGALLSDIIIFLFIRYSFIKEIEKLKKEKFVIFTGKILKKLFGSFNNYLLPITAGFLIVSPLPTEIGVALMATMKRVPIKKFLLVAYVLHTAGIFLILLIGNSI